MPRKWKPKEAGAALLKSDKMVFSAKAVIRDKEGHSITIKGLFHEEDMIITTISLIVDSFRRSEHQVQIFLRYF